MGSIDNKYINRLETLYEKDNKEKFLNELNVYNTLLANYLLVSYDKKKIKSSDKINNLYKKAITLNDTDVQNLRSYTIKILKKYDPQNILFDLLTYFLMQPALNEETRSVKHCLIENREEVQVSEEKFNLFSHHSHQSLELVNKYSTDQILSQEEIEKFNESINFYKNEYGKNLYFPNGMNPDDLDNIINQLAERGLTLDTFYEALINPEKAHSEAVVTIGKLFYDSKRTTSIPFKKL
ncbi:MAG: hypothetical protein Q8K60_03005 [Parachlamydiaceae bacterium]|nr:hypothetical protein [Parachlamydiaceae bacterium]